MLSPRCVTGSLVSLLLVLPLGSLAPGDAAAQSVERTLFVSAVDEAGRPVDQLSPADLLVREDGVAREVLRASRATTPMQVAILVDNTAAMTAEISNLREATLALVRALTPDHEVSLVSYGDRPTILVNPTTSTLALEQGVGRIFAQPNAGSYVLDAIVETSRGFAKRGATRPVIVLLATEAVEFSHAHPDQVVEALAEAGAALHAIVLTRPGGGDYGNTEVRNRNVVFDRGPRETGGQRISVLSSMAYTAQAETLAAELTSQFEVVFARPPALIPPSKTTVESTAPGLKVRGTLARLPVRGPGA